jgi:hypothetical protein
MKKSFCIGSIIFFFSQTIKWSSFGAKVSFLNRGNWTCKSKSWISSICRCCIYIENGLIWWKPSWLTKSKKVYCYSYLIMIWNISDFSVDWSICCENKLIKFTEWSSFIITIHWKTLCVGWNENIISLIRIPSIFQWNLWSYCIWIYLVSTSVFCV